MSVPARLRLTVSSVRGVVGVPFCAIRLVHTNGSGATHSVESPLAPVQNGVASFSPAFEHSISIEEPKAKRWDAAADSVEISILVKKTDNAAGSSDVVVASLKFAVTQFVDRPPSTGRQDASIECSWLRMSSPGCDAELQISAVLRVPPSARASAKAREATKTDSPAAALSSAAPAGTFAALASTFRASAAGAAEILGENGSGIAGPAVAPRRPRSALSTSGPRPASSFNRRAAQEGKQAGIKPASPAHGSYGDDFDIDSDDDMPGSAAPSAGYSGVASDRKMGSAAHESSPARFLKSDLPALAAKSIGSPGLHDDAVISSDTVSKDQEGGARTLEATVAATSVLPVICNFSSDSKEIVPSDLHVGAAAGTAISTSAPGIAAVLNSTTDNKSADESILGASSGLLGLSVSGSLAAANPELSASVTNNSASLSLFPGLIDGSESSAGKERDSPLLASSLLSPSQSSLVITTEEQPLPCKHPATDTGLGISASSEVVVPLFSIPQPLLQGSPAASTPADGFVASASLLRATTKGKAEPEMANSVPDVSFTPSTFDYVLFEIGRKMPEDAAFAVLCYLWRALSGVLFFRKDLRWRSLSSSPAIPHALRQLPRSTALEFTFPRVLHSPMITNFLEMAGFRKATQSRSPSLDTLELPAFSFPEETDPNTSKTLADAVSAIEFELSRIMGSGFVSAAIARTETNRLLPLTVAAESTSVDGIDPSMASCLLALHGGLALLRRYLLNPVSDPRDPRFWRISTGNPVFQDRIVRVFGSADTSAILACCMFDPTTIGMPAGRPGGGAFLLRRSPLHDAVVAGQAEPTALPLATSALEPAVILHLKRCLLSVEEYIMLVERRLLEQCGISVTVDVGDTGSTANARPTVGDVPVFQNSVPSTTSMTGGVPRSNVKSTLPRGAADILRSAPGADFDEASLLVPLLLHGRLVSKKQMGSVVQGVTDIPLQSRAAVGNSKVSPVAGRPPSGHITHSEPTAGKINDSAAILSVDKASAVAVSASAAQYTGMILDVGARLGLALSQLRLLASAFSRYDGRKCGAIRVSDLAAVLASEGRPLAERGASTLAAWMKLRDINTDGVVSLPEYLASFAALLFPPLSPPSFLMSLAYPQSGPNVPSLLLRPTISDRKVKNAGAAAASALSSTSDASQRLLASVAAVSKAGSARAALEIELELVARVSAAQALLAAPSCDQEIAVGCPPPSVSTSNPCQELVDDSLFDAAFSSAWGGPVILLVAAVGMLRLLADADVARTIAVALLEHLDLLLSRPNDSNLWTLRVATSMPSPLGVSADQPSTFSGISLSTKILVECPGVHLLLISCGFQPISAKTSAYLEYRLAGLSSYAWHCLPDPYVQKIAACARSLRRHVIAFDVPEAADMSAALLAVAHLHVGPISATIPMIFSRRRQALSAALAKVAELDAAWALSESSGFGADLPRLPASESASPLRPSGKLLKTGVMVSTPAAPVKKGYATEAVDAAAEIFISESVLDHAVTADVGLASSWCGALENVVLVLQSSLKLPVNRIAGVGAKSGSSSTADLINRLPVRLPVPKHYFEDCQDLRLLEATTGCATWDSSALLIAAGFRFGSDGMLALPPTVPTTRLQARLLEIQAVLPFLRAVAAAAAAVSAVQISRVSESNAHSPSARNTADGIPRERKLLVGVTDFSNLSSVYDDAVERGGDVAAGNPGISTGKLLLDLSIQDPVTTANAMSSNRADFGVSFTSGVSDTLSSGGNQDGKSHSDFSPAVRRQRPSSAPPYAPSHEATVPTSSYDSERLVTVLLSENHVLRASAGGRIAELEADLAVARRALRGRQLSVPATASVPVLGSDFAPGGNARAPEASSAHALATVTTGATGKALSASPARSAVRRRPAASVINARRLVKTKGVAINAGEPPNVPSDDCLVGAPFELVGAVDPDSRAVRLRRRPTCPSQPWPACGDVLIAGGHGDARYVFVAAISADPATDTAHLRLSRPLGNSCVDGAPVAVRAPTPAQIALFVKDLVEIMLRDIVLPEVVSCAAAAGEARVQLRVAEHTFCHRRVRARVPMHILSCQHTSVQICDVRAEDSDGSTALEATEALQRFERISTRIFATAAGLCALRSEPKSRVQHMRPTAADFQLISGLFSCANPRAVDSVAADELWMRGNADPLFCSAMASQATVATHAVWAPGALAHSLPTVARIWERFGETVVALGASRSGSLSSTPQKYELNQAAFALLFRPLHPFDHLTLPESTLDVVSSAHTHPSSEILALTSPEYWGEQWESVKAVAPHLSEEDIATAAAAFAAVHAEDFALKATVRLDELDGNTTMSTSRLEQVQRACRISICSAMQICQVLDGDSPSPSYIRAFLCRMRSTGNVAVDSPGVSSAAEDSNRISITLQPGIEFFELMQLRLERDRGMLTANLAVGLNDLERARRALLPMEGLPRWSILRDRLRAAYGSIGENFTARAAATETPAPVVFPTDLLDSMRSSSRDRHLLQFPLFVRDRPRNSVDFVTLQDALEAMASRQRMQLVWANLFGTIIRVASELASSADAPAENRSRGIHLPVMSGALSLSADACNSLALNSGTAPSGSTFVIDSAVSASGGVLYTLTADGMLSATDAITLETRFRTQVLPPAAAEAVVLCRECSTSELPFIGPLILTSQAHCASSSVASMQVMLLPGKSSPVESMKGCALAPAVAGAVVSLAGEPSSWVAINASAALLALYSTGLHSNGAPGRDLNEIRWMADVVSGGHIVACVTPRFLVEDALVSSAPTASTTSADSGNVPAVSINCPAGSSVLLSEVVFLPHLHAMVSVAFPFENISSAESSGAAQAVSSAHWPRVLGICCLTGAVVSDLGPLNGSACFGAHLTFLPHAMQVIACDQISVWHNSDAADNNRVESLSPWLIVYDIAPLANLLRVHREAFITAAVSCSQPSSNMSPTPRPCIQSMPATAAFDVQTAFGSSFDTRHLKEVRSLTYLPSSRVIALAIADATGNDRSRCTQVLLVDAAHQRHRLCFPPLDGITLGRESPGFYLGQVPAFYVSSSSGIRADQRWSPIPKGYHMLTCNASAQGLSHFLAASHRVFPQNVFGNERVEGSESASSLQNVRFCSSRLHRPGYSLKLSTSAPCRVACDPALVSAACSLLSQGSNDFTESLVEGSRSPVPSRSVITQAPKDSTLAYVYVLRDGSNWMVEMPMVEASDASNHHLAPPRTLDPRFIELSDQTWLASCPLLYLSSQSLAVLKHVLYHRNSVVRIFFIASQGVPPSQLQARLDETVSCGVGDSVLATLVPISLAPFDTLLGKLLAAHDSASGVRGRAVRTLPFLLNFFETEAFRSTTRNGFPGTTLPLVIIPFFSEGGDAISFLRPTPLFSSVACTASALRGSSVGDSDASLLFVGAGCLPPMMGTVVAHHALGLHSDFVDLALDHMDVVITVPSASCALLQTVQKIVCPWPSLTTDAEGLGVDRRPGPSFCLGDRVAVGGAWGLSEAACAASGILQPVADGPSADVLTVHSIEARSSATPRPRSVQLQSRVQSIIVVAPTFPVSVQDAAISRARELTVDNTALIQNIHTQILSATVSNSLAEASERASAWRRLATQKYLLSSESSKLSTATIGDDDGTVQVAAIIQNSADAIKPFWSDSDAFECTECMAFVYANIPATFIAPRNSDTSTLLRCSWREPDSLNVSLILQAMMAVVWHFPLLRFGLRSLISPVVATDQYCEQISSSGLVNRSAVSVSGLDVSAPKKDAAPDFRLDPQQKIRCVGSTVSQLFGSLLFELVDAGAIESAASVAGHSELLASRSQLVVAFTSARDNAARLEFLLPFVTDRASAGEVDETAVSSLWNVGMKESQLDSLVRRGASHWRATVAAVEASISLAATEADNRKVILIDEPEQEPNRIAAHALMKLCSDAHAAVKAVSAGTIVEAPTDSFISAVCHSLIARCPAVSIMDAETAECFVTRALDYARSSRASLIAAAAVSTTLHSLAAVVASSGDFHASQDISTIPIIYGRNVLNCCHLAAPGPMLAMSGIADTPRLLLYDVPKYAAFVEHFRAQISSLQTVLPQSISECGISDGWVASFSSASATLQSECTASPDSALISLLSCGVVEALTQVCIHAVCESIRYPAARTDLLHKLLTSLSQCLLNTLHRLDGAWVAAVRMLPTSSISARFGDFPLEQLMPDSPVAIVASECRRVLRAVAHAALGRTSGLTDAPCVVHAGDSAPYVFSSPDLTLFGGDCVQPAYISQFYPQIEALLAQTVGLEGTGSHTLAVVRAVLAVDSKVPGSALVSPGLWAGDNNSHVTRSTLGLLASCALVKGLETSPFFAGIIAAVHEPKSTAFFESSSCDVSSPESNGIEAPLSFAVCAANFFAVINIWALQQQTHPLCCFQRGAAYWRTIFAAISAHRHYHCGMPDPVADMQSDAENKYSLSGRGAAKVDSRRAGSGGTVAVAKSTAIVEHARIAERSMRRKQSISVLATLLNPPSLGITEDASDVAVSSLNIAAAVSDASLPDLVSALLNDPDFEVRLMAFSAVCGLYQWLHQFALPGFVAATRQSRNVESAVDAAAFGAWWALGLRFRSADTTIFIARRLQLYWLLASGSYDDRSSESSESVKVAAHGVDVLLAHATLRIASPSTWRVCGILPLLVRLARLRPKSAAHSALTRVSKCEPSLEYISHAAARTLSSVCIDVYSRPLLALARSDAATMAWAASTGAESSNFPKGGWASIISFGSAPSASDSGLRVAKDARSNWAEALGHLTLAAQRFISAIDPAAPEAIEVNGDREIIVPAEDTDVIAASRVLRSVADAWPSIRNSFIGQSRRAALLSVAREDAHALSSTCRQLETGALALWTLATAAWRMMHQSGAGNSCRPMCGALLASALGLVEEALQHGWVATAALLGAADVAGTSSPASCAEQVDSPNCIPSEASDSMWPGVALLVEMLGQPLPLLVHDPDPVRALQARAGVVLAATLQAAVPIISVAIRHQATSESSDPTALLSAHAPLAAALVRCALRAQVAPALAHAMNDHAQFLRTITAAGTAAEHLAAYGGALLLDGIEGRSSLLSALLQLALVDGRKREHPSSRFEFLHALPVATAAEVGASGVWDALTAAMLGEQCFLDGTALPAALSLVAGRHTVRLEAVSLLWLVGCLLLQHIAQCRRLSDKPGAATPVFEGVVLLQESLCSAALRHGVVEAERARLWRFRDRALHPTVTVALQALAMASAGSVSGQAGQVRRALDAVGVPAAALRWCRVAEDLQRQRLGGPGQASHPVATTQHNTTTDAAISSFRAAESAAALSWSQWLLDKFSTAPTGGADAEHTALAADSFAGSAAAADADARSSLRLAVTKDWYRTDKEAGSRANALSTRLSASMRSTMAEITLTAEALDALAADDGRGSVASRRRGALRAEPASPAGGSRKPRIRVNVNLGSAAAGAPLPSQLSQPRAAAPANRTAAVVMWAPPRAAASDVAASAVAATSRVLDRLGDAVVHVKAAFDAACAASQDAAGLPGALQVPGALLVSEPALRALLLLAGQHAYPARCHAEAQRRGLLPPEEPRGDGARPALSFSSFLRLLAFVVDDAAEAGGGFDTAAQAATTEEKMTSSSIA